MTDEETWHRNDCKAFAALQAPAPAPVSASATVVLLQRQVLTPASADASPAPTTRAQTRMALIMADVANKPPAVDTVGYESHNLELRDVARHGGHGGRSRGQGRAAGRQGGQAPAARSNSWATRLGIAA